MGLLVKVMRPFMRSPAKGADTAVYLASSADAEGISGKYFADRKVKKSRESSYDTAITAPAVAGQRRSRRPPGRPETLILRRVT